MANREALRELQTRLATRLQAARSEGLSVSWLAVEAGGAHYMLSLAQSGEIFPWANIQPVPYTQPWFMGVANLRGGLFGVVDFAGFVASTWPLGAAAAVRSEQALADSSLLALNTALDVNVALLVDSLAGLRGGDAFTSAEPAPRGTPDYFGKVYVIPKGCAGRKSTCRRSPNTPRFSASVPETICS